MSCSKSWLTALMIGGLLACFHSGLAQTVSGTITGTVVDAKSFAVAGATVTLTSEDTGAQVTQKTNPTGDVFFTAVLPGRYSVAAEMAGFRKVLKQNLRITAAERLSAGEFTLQVGSVNESITVDATSTPVQTTSDERSSVITTAQLGNLMSRGRDFLSLLRVLPSVVPPSDPDTIGRSAYTNIQGMRTTYSTVSIDGVSTNDLGSMQAMGAPMNMDAVSEVKVLMTNYQAEYGRTAGVLIQAVTKSGTNQYHGGGYYYKRNEEFNANSFFNNRNGLPIARYRFNTWGYNLGGPVPKLKNKLFFFFSQEILPTKVPGTLQNVTVPTAAQRSGDYSAQLPGIVVRDPKNQAPFPGNIVPASRIDPNGQKILQLFPQPNIDFSVTRGAYNYTVQEVMPALRLNEVYRADYNVTERLRLYVRGSNYRQRQDGFATPGGAAQWGMMNTRNRYTDDSGVANLTYTINPATVNEFNFAVHHDTNRTFPFSQADVDKLGRSKNGLTLGQFYPNLNVLDMIPWASFTGIQSAAAFSTDSRFPTQSTDAIFDYSDNFTKIFNRHTVKAGVYYERVRYFSGGRGTNFGSFDFRSDTNNPLNTGYAYSNALLGVFYSYQESNTRVETNGRGNTLEWFLQDSWRASRRLTLEYGARFTWYTPYADTKKQASSFLPNLFDPKQAPRLYYPALNPAGQRVAFDSVTNTFAPAVLIGALVPSSGNTANGMALDDGKTVDRGLMNHQGILIAPRFGFAYDVTGDGKTAIRGGFGINYNARERVLLLDVAQTPPVQYTPTIYYGAMSTLFSSGAGTLFPVSTAGLSVTGKVPSVYNYSIGIQRNVGFNTVLDVAYVGALGRHLLDERNLNALPYGYRFLPQNQDTTTGRPLPDNYLVPYRGYSSTIQLDEFASSSSYHSMQAQVNRRFTRGLQFGGTWTWSKSMDFVSNDFAFEAAVTPIRVWNYGKSDFDRTHIVQINALWDLPKATRLIRNKVIGAIADNWQLSGIASFVSGAPSGISLTTTTGVDIPGGGDGVRPLVVSQPIISKSERSIAKFFDPSVFVMPGLGTYGNAPRDVVRGPGINNIDMTIFKNVRVKERASLQLRFEAYNVFNHTQFSGMNTTAQFNPANGQQVNAAFGTLTSARSPRVGQASLRVIF